MADKIKINRRKEYREQLNLYLNLTKNLNAKLKRLFKKTGRQAEREFLETGDMYYKFLEPFSNELYKTLARHYEAVIRQTTERIIKQRTKQEDEIDVIVQTYIATVTASKVTQVSETTKKQIRQAIKKGIAEGLAINEIRKIIRQNKSFSPYRSTMIARTETHSAMNYGNFEISKTLGLNNPVKQWNAAQDDRTREWHRNMDGKVVARDDVFKVMTPIKGGGAVEKRMMYTGDYQNGGGSNVINCRCFTLYYDSEDEII